LVVNPTPRYKLERVKPIRNLRKPIQASIERYAAAKNVSHRNRG